MDLSFFPLTLDAMDQASAESLCLFIASDERPLTGLAGMVDWRLTGRLSRLLRGGLLTGDSGEAVLTQPGPRLGYRKMFLFGVGPASQPEPELREQVAEALRKLGQAGVQEAAMQLPSRLSPELGVRTLIDELTGPGRALVFASDPQKLISALSQTARGFARVEQRVVKVPAPSPAIPRASPLPFAPQAPSEPPVAPAMPSEPPPAAPADEKKPPATGPQRYVPQPARQNVFEKKKK
jgi:hypothetical protein